MDDQSRLSLAVIGVGNMGSAHARDLSSMDGARLVAVCDKDPERADQVAGAYGVKAFYDPLKLLDEERPQAVLIATPHYTHTPLSIASLERGIHVLVEKPLAVHVNAGRQMIAAWEWTRRRYPHLVFAIMFQQRTYTYWRKVRQLIQRGELGRLARVTWIVTDWFRTQSYYDHGGWRGTWKGEGGGVLLNQAPHILDLYQWFFGMPSRITGFAAIGKYHRIEVEDEGTAFFEHENGMVGHFITTTAESPGTNRLEIVGELGRLVFENGKLLFSRNRSSMLEFIRTSPAAFDKVACDVEDVPFEPQLESGHAALTQAFIRAVLQRQQPVAAAAEGIASLTLGNSIMLSHFLQRPVELPLDADAYERKLNEMIGAQ